MSAHDLVFVRSPMSASMIHRRRSPAQGEPGTLGRRIVVVDSWWWIVGGSAGFAHGNQLACWKILCDFDFECGASHAIDGAPSSPVNLGEEVLVVVSIEYELVLQVFNRPVGRRRESHPGVTAGFVCDLKHVV